MSKRPSLESQTRAVHEWNAPHNVGKTVRVRRDDGSVLTTKTRSQAWLLGGHTAVILVDGIAGAFALDRVTVF